MSEMEMSAALVLRGPSHWPADGHLSPRPHMGFPLYLYFLISSFHEDARPVGPGPMLKTSFVLITSLKTLPPDTVTF